jgi:GNAT superfamily N-acetyltransferase
MPQPIQHTSAETSSGVLRCLTAADIPEAMKLSTAAGWNQIPEDWQMFRELAPDTCFGIECEGKLAATTTLISYADQLAWVGMVLTDSQYQRRGFATRLVEQALKCADGRGIRSVKLDATEQGRPVYERLGFRVEQEIQRWSTAQRPASGSAPRWDGSSQITSNLDFGLDRIASGADRSDLLRILSRRAPPFCNSAGFLLSRPGTRASYIGPFVAPNREAAYGLLRSRFDTGDTIWFWDILSSNRAAVSLAKEFGFKPQRTLLRMVRGADLRGNDALMFGIAGFELG